MSVHEAEPGDVYVDENGKLWRVIGVCGEPTVIVREIEPDAPESPPVTRSGGVSGYMWHGWKRVHRQPEKKPNPTAYRLDGTQNWQA
jgi:hypothetical protein